MNVKLWKWQKGRQYETEYFKFPLWYFKIWKFGFDGYILKYSDNTVLDWHTDKIKNGKHWRLNIKLKGENYFSINKEKVIIHKPYKLFMFFRPDLVSHRLIVVSKTIKLSFGFVKFD